MNKTQCFKYPLCLIGALSAFALAGCSNKRARPIAAAPVTVGKLQFQAAKGSRSEAILSGTVTNKTDRKIMQVEMDLWLAPMGQKMFVRKLDPHETVRFSKTVSVAKPPAPTPVELVNLRIGTEDPSGGTEQVRWTEYE